MSLLLKNALIVDAKSSKNQEKCNILIEEGSIASLNGDGADEEIDVNGKIVCPGWFDLNANFNDPGREIKEDLNSGSVAATRGGFTDVHLVPDTMPPIETKADVSYLLRSSGGDLDLHVSAALSEGLQGNDLTEIFDLHSAGAISVSDGDNPIWNSELLLKALQYTSDIGVPVFQNPRDKHLSANTHMNEGKESTLLGLRGEPGLSEVLTIKRDLDVLKYSGGRLHFTKISTAESVDLVLQAKNDGLSVTADVAIQNLLFTDGSIEGFDSNYKAIPPYRTEEDRSALLMGVREGVIDAICSNHRPQDLENKQLEFDLAEPGVISLQTLLPNLLTLTNEVPLSTLVQRLTEGPRKVLGVDQIVIKEGQKAKLTIFDPTEKWVFNDESNQSKSRNTPFWDSELTGKVVGTINGLCHNLFD